MKITQKQRLHDAQIRNLKKLKMKICPSCKTKYQPTAFTQIYCKTDCRLQVKKAYSKIVCSNCRHKIQLKFDPIHNLKKLKNIICPKCGKPAFHIK